MKFDFFFVDDYCEQWHIQRIYRSATQLSIWISKYLVKKTTYNKYFTCYVVRFSKTQKLFLKLRFLDPPLILNNGDNIEFKCQYNSMNRTNATVSGPATHNEMCSFALYVTSITKGIVFVFVFRYLFFEKKLIGKAASSIDLCPAGPDIPNIDCKKRVT